MSEGTFEMVQDDGFDAAVEAKIAAATGTEPEVAPEAATPEAKPERERDEHGRYKPAAEPEPDPDSFEYIAETVAVAIPPTTGPHFWKLPSKVLSFNNSQSGGLTFDTDISGGDLVFDTES